MLTVTICCNGLSYWCGLTTFIVWHGKVAPKTRSAAENDEILISFAGIWPQTKVLQKFKF